MRYILRKSEPHEVAKTAARSQKPVQCIRSPAASQNVNKLLGKGVSLHDKVQLFSLNKNVKFVKLYNCNVAATRRCTLRISVHRQRKIT